MVRAEKLPTCLLLICLTSIDSLDVCIHGYVLRGALVDLSKKVEDVINATVKSKPDEPISFMV